MESRYQQSGIFIIAAWRFCQPCVPRLSTARRYQRRADHLQQHPDLAANERAATVYPSYLVPQNLRPPYIAWMFATVFRCRWLPLFSVVSVPARPGFGSPDALRIQQQNGLDLVDSVVNRALEEERFGVTIFRWFRTQSRDRLKSTLWRKKNCRF